MELGILLKFLKPSFSLTVGQMLSRLVMSFGQGHQPSGSVSTIIASSSANAVRFCQRKEDGP
jgi:hypothetical protein